WDQISTDAEVTGSNPDPPHERLSLQAVVRKPGYVYIYYSNEETEDIVEVYFDDLIVKQRHGPVVQGDDYYPFGLTFNSYSRENSTPNMYQYNSKEKQDELGLDWLDYGARMYMADIGRWGSVDPLALKYHTFSPYNYALNNPVKFIEPDGKQIIGVTRKDAEQAEEDIHKLFAGDKFEQFRSLVGRTGKKGNGKDFKKIDKDAL